MNGNNKINRLSEYHMQTDTGEVLFLLTALVSRRKPAVGRKNVIDTGQI